MDDQIALAIPDRGLFRVVNSCFDGRARGNNATNAHNEALMEVRTNTGV